MFATLLHCYRFVSFVTFVILRLLTMGLAVPLTLFLLLSSVVQLWSAGFYLVVLLFCFAVWLLSRRGLNFSEGKQRGKWREGRREVGGSWEEWKEGNCGSGCERRIFQFLKRKITKDNK